MDSELKILIAKAKDIVRLRDLKNIPKFSTFLSPSESQMILSSVKSPNCYFFGGFEGAERLMFGAIPDYITELNAIFPIKALVFKYRKVDRLTHRDFLGSFMGAGVTREVIGDICVGEGETVAFVTDEISSYLAQQIVKVGKVGVTVTTFDVSEVKTLLTPSEVKQLNFTVSSLRLDAVLSGLVGCSRTKAEKYISDGLVYVNSFETTKVTKQILVGDRITLRGTGKFVITGLGNITKKGREVITAEKYI